ncbi:hypothetical protein GOBAR_AA12513 [Gossypium barbadense]|uniref:Uncharacterized protein n=1 Tax=Gossypium barbadense TaxID=3634 RepID=A0A2P5XXR1_GOSBA|nr:hypothetical protein GOBAR_AA12513 [Gossypium barbadense]
MEGCMAISSEGKSDDLALILDDGEVIRFTGFYGQADPNLRKQSWDMLKKVKSTINESWVVEGGFNSILNNAKKEGGRRKPRSSIDAFRSKLGEYSKNPRSWFRYDECWAKEQEARDIIIHIWSNEGSDFLNKLEMVPDKLDSNGDWHEDKSEICNIVWSYFNDLFKTTIASNGDVDLNVIPDCITMSMNSSFNKEFTDEEIFSAFKQMDPRKALRINGLSGSFFKEHWPIVGNDVLSLCLDILKGN